MNICEKCTFTKIYSEKSRSIIMFFTKKRVRHIHNSVNCIYELEIRNWFTPCNSNYHSGLI